MSTDITIRNISFIVIARNEEGVISRCLDAIIRLEFVDCELICVDSASTDRTLTIMKEYQDKYPNFIVLSPIDCRNAAVARNYGIRAATKSKLFFVDGDVELKSEFVHAAIEELEEPDVFAVTGGLEEVVYADPEKTAVFKKWVRLNYPKRQLVLSCGGTYIAEMEAIQATGFYDERFFRSQDLDYAFRLAAMFPMVALPMPMGVHHTGEYRGRPWQHLLKGHILNQGMLARKHAARQHFWRYWYSSRKSFVWGFVAVNMLLLFCAGYLLGAISWIPAAIIATILLAFEVFYSIAKTQSILSTLINHLLSPYGVFLGFCIEPFIGKSSGEGNDTSGRSGLE